VSKNCIYLVGLGPGNPSDIPDRNLEILKATDPVFLRTSRHPSVARLVAEGVRFTSFDYLYESLDTFEQVYDAIAREVISRADESNVAYAVPGHPLVLERSVAVIISQCSKERLRIMPAMSFLDAVIGALNLYDLETIQLVDSHGLDTEGINPSRPVLLTQIYSRLVASTVKLDLMRIYPDDHPITVVSAAGVEGQERVAHLKLYELDRLDWVDHLTTAYVPPILEHKVGNVTPLIRVVEELRSEHGCPWDKEQTHKTLSRYLIEEAYETTEAIELEDMHKLCEELGDLLLQIVLHAQIASETRAFTFSDVVRGITEKMVRRHPHVFGDATAHDSAEVLAKWEKIKARERDGGLGRSLMDDIPKFWPSLMSAEKVQRIASTVGFDWIDMDGVLDKVAEEIKELEQATRNGKRQCVEEEIGDLLFTIVNLSRFLSVDPELALKKSIRKFVRRFKRMEREANAAGKNIEGLSMDELDSLWEQAKKEDM